MQQVKSIDIYNKSTEKTAEDNSDSEEEDDMDRKERFEEELACINKASEKFLSETGSKLPASPKPVPVESQAFTNSAEMQAVATKGLSATISDIVPAEANTSTPTPDSGTDTASTEEPSHSEVFEGSKDDTGQKPTENGQALDDDVLAQLNDLEAEIMNVLEDTNSVDFQNVQAKLPVSPRRFTFSEGLSSNSPPRLSPKRNTLPHVQTTNPPTATAKKASEADLSKRLLSKKSDALKNRPKSSILPASSSQGKNTIGESPRRKVVK